MAEYQIPFKVNRVLNVILLALLLIFIRAWYLAVIQRDEQIEQAIKPKRRVMIEHVERGTIRDCFNMPLAVNRVQYNATVSYAQLREIPATSWEKNEEGKQIKVPKRSLYIKKLASLLGKELEIDPQTIEDLIHGKAALFPHTPFLVKEDISEKQYYRLRMLEREWIGIHAERTSKRFYPKGKVGADVIGYLGSINQKEYMRVSEEIKTLQDYLSAREAGEPVILPKGFQTPLEVKKRLQELQEKAYTINDQVGKTGIECFFDEQLRGFCGKKTYEVDVKGNFLRELPGARKPVRGQKIYLTLSSELQEYAEALLAENEAVRDFRDRDGNIRLDHAWIKGGAIVALSPKTGQVYAMASYPRIDPNDFIPSRDEKIRKQKAQRIPRWLENETYIGEIWDGKRPLERERYSSKENKYYEDTLELTWHHFLDIILPFQSPIRNAMNEISTIHIAFSLQKNLEELLHLSGQNDYHLLLQALYSESPHLPSKASSTIDAKKQIKESLEKSANRAAFLKSAIDPLLGKIPHNDDKLLVVDLCRLLINTELFSSDLLEVTKTMDLSTYRTLSQRVHSLEAVLYSKTKELYHTLDFKIWRESSFKDFLKEKRREEKQNKKYARPFTDYLEQIEEEKFSAFWRENKLTLLTLFILGTSYQNERENQRLVDYKHALLAWREEQKEKFTNLNVIQDALSFIPPFLRKEFVQTMRSFKELNRPILGKYRTLRNQNGQQLEKHLAASFYPLAGYGYGRSQAFRQSCLLGSVFKIVTAYQGLKERYFSLSSKNKTYEALNPLTLIDDLQWTAKPGSNSQILGYTLDGTPITRLYKGIRLPRSSHSGIGKVDLLGALEQSSNVYFSILAAEHLEDPTSLAEAARLFGFGEKSGISLPGEIAGVIPNDLAFNRTGLCSFAIGQHTLVVTPLQTALMISAVVNSGLLIKPQIVHAFSGEAPLSKDNLFSQDDYPLKNSLSLAGIFFPLFTETTCKDQQAFYHTPQVEVRRSIYLPSEISDCLLEGMRRVIVGPKGTARPQAIRLFKQYPQWMRDYIDMQHQLVGKTGTPQVLYKQTIDAETEPRIRTHVWFAGSSFSPSAPAYEDPELVVAVYLRFAEYGGKEAAALGVQMIKKWREILDRHKKDSK